MTKRDFPVVGIGASAGGIEALNAFFRGLPADSGMAFVVIMHLPLDYASSLPEILGRMTTMPVASATDGAPLERNHVYVGPAGHVVTTSDGALHLEARVSAKQQRPIDVFLTSLAVSHGEQSVGIILSGAGSDGTIGVKAIKERGGLTIAQGTDGSGPRHSGMPESAIAVGVVDLITPVENIAAKLVQLVNEADEFGDGDEALRDELERARLEICRILQDQIGHDFSGYKDKTFMRRVRRRMQISQISTFEGYVARLRDEPEEVTLLFRDLLIGVTNFFRDKDAFQALQESVVPRLFEGLSAADTVRIWVPGCATGEEVYSLAILMREHTSTLRNAPKVQLFATDIDEAALSIARGGRYPAPLLASVSPERLGRFFTKDDASYLIAKEIRDMCIFSPHSVIRDPPFSRIDLISCRNLLIYLGAEFQSRVIPVFHFALRPSGYLFLGTSENIGQHSELFQRIDRKHRLFQRRDNVPSSATLPSFSGRGRLGPIAPAIHHPAGGQGIAYVRKTADARIVEHFAPAHVVVNSDGDIIHYSMRTGKYLEAAPGSPSRELVSLARRGLRGELRAVLQEAKATRRSATRERIQVEIDDRIQVINLVVEPLGNHEPDPVFLVLFIDVGPPLSATAIEHGRHLDGNSSVEQLEIELRETRERLQSTVEEYETALEEVKASNEEMVSVNEELQSANEELDTSKEEMQSVNEELQTVNQELNAKVDELDRANLDLRNVFESTRIASIFVDGDMVIRSFTPAATSIFSLIATDRGRPLTNIVSTVDLGDLRHDMRTAVEQDKIIERSVRSAVTGAHYIMRILPYRDRQNGIDGGIVTFFEVTKMVEAEAQQRTMVEELNHRVRNMLTVVNAIAAQTLNRAGSVKEFGDTFLGRIQSLAKSHSLLSREQWAPVQLLDILKAELDQHARDGDGRVVLSGPAVAFRPQAAVALGLVFHELTTNATKYGALSKDSGKLSVTWAIEPANGKQRQVAVEWKETGGPAVKAPKRVGFGTELIDREANGTLKGAVVREYSPKGLKLQLSIPLDAAPGAKKPAK